MKKLPRIKWISLYSSHTSLIRPLTTSFIMSGLEVVGVIASIIQIADLGAKLSVKLCTFYKTVKVINKSIQELSSDVSLTCSILNELGKTLEQDDQTKLCSKQAFSTAQEVLQQCKSVFEEIDTAIEKHSQENEKGRLVRQARKITIAFLGPDLDVLKSNLERLKSTTLLMLHVIMYAGQLRRTNMKSTMANQRGLIQTLLEEKIANDAKFNNLRQSIQAVSMPKDDNSFQPSITALSIDPQPTPLWNEVGEYYNLVRGLLCQIDAYQDILEQSRHLRIRNGVINVHSAESVLFQHIHGQAANQLFDDPIFRFRDASFPTSPQFSQSSHAKDETAKLGESPMNPVQPSPYGAHQSSLCLPPTTYPPPPPQLGNGVLHHNPYGPSPQESPYYTTHSPYTSNPASARYASGGKPSSFFLSCWWEVVGVENWRTRAWLFLTFLVIHFIRLIEDIN
ncbi:unnamed protein product [Penicillium egyptiacum]|uniref:Azaphilone pigments biosynthesis cluster protein L N-terminal domain-containing protein n=1 Tax=Penicillium egyptiacum TaxID=1303716 RepID=A0A9W4KE63_9EURO|nr:unnamed protein product [Penicillium egyptiacum]